MIYILPVIILAISLINSHLLNLFWVDYWLYVDWNYEFTKSIFSTISLSLITLIFLLKNYKKKIISNIYIPIIILIFFISSITSLFPLTNILWLNSKWHGLLMLGSLLSFYLVLINTKKKSIDKIIKYSLIFSLIPFLIAIKEFFIPSFDYGNLSNRAIGTFWHPNYLALYVLILIPFLLENIKKKIYLFIFLISVFVLFLTKSLFWILIFIWYILFYLSNKYKVNKKILWLIIVSLLILTSYIIYQFWLITKLNSFISRFYIWESTLNIIFSNPYNIIFWVWNDSLIYLFDNYKSPFLYIYENIGFSADRPHNLLLQIFYNFWLIWIIIFSSSLKKLYKKYKNNSFFHSIILFLLFTIFNFSSVIVYIILVILIAYISKRKIKKSYHYTIKNIFIISAILSIIISSFYYYFEALNYKKIEIDNKIYNEFKNENIEKEIFNKNLLQEELCIELTGKVKSVENYFFCWDILWHINNNQSIIYYKKWLEIIPNMWDKESRYNKNIIVKSIFSEARFYSSKYSNIKTILNRVNLKQY